MGGPKEKKEKEQTAQLFSHFLLIKINFLFPFSINLQINEEKMEENLILIKKMFTGFAWLFSLLSFS